MKHFVKTVLTLFLTLALMACLAEEEAAFPLAGYKIGIDPGHQAHANTDKEPIAPGSDTMKAKTAGGTRGVSTGVPEYQLDLDIALELRDLLELLGAEVLMTRETNDVDISNIERAQLMNDWGADCVLRIHADGSVLSASHGAAMYVRKTGEKAAECYALAACLEDALCETTGAYKKGVFRRDTYTGLNWSTVPCVLVEVGYMTNPDEDVKLNDPEYRTLIVKGLAEGIINWLDTEANK